jgi:hypothetical protein
MKKHVITLMLTALSAGFAAAQSVEPVTPPATTKDTTKIVLGTTKVLIVDVQDVNKTAADTIKTKSESEIKESLSFWSGIDLGVNTLFNAGGTNTAPEGADWLDLDESRSLSWSINFYQEKIKLIGNHVGILTGAGLTYNSYGIKTNARVLSNSDSTYANVVPDSLYRFSKNKLRATYLRVPLMIEFNTSNDPDRTVHLAVGAIGGLRIGSITKQHYEIDGQNYRDRVKSDFNLSPFTLDAAVRVGYKDFTLWANYGLTPLFEKDKGPEVYTLSVGVTVLPF